MSKFRERCAECIRKINQDGILRQHDPVETLMAFVQSEIGRTATPSLEDTLSLILYFSDEEGREEFLQLVRSAKPAMVARKIP